jgi:hypothetical protein
LYAASFSPAWGAVGAVVFRLFPFSDNSFGAPFFGPLSFAAFAFLSASFAALFFFLLFPVPHGVCGFITS